MSETPRHYLDFEKPIAELEASIEEIEKRAESAGPGYGATFTLRFKKG